MFQEVENLLRTLDVLEIDTHVLFSSLDTPYSKYSTSNYTAPVLEIPAIREIISQRQKQDDAIDTLVERTESILHLLREKRKQVKSSMRTHDGFVSCIRRLPSDVLREIFMRCLPKGMTLALAKNVAPLLLPRVCRSWRDVVLDTPRLWSWLHISPTKKPEQQFSLYNRFLTNARLCTLSLAVRLDGHLCYEQWATMAIQFLQLHTSRCVELNICFDIADDLYRLLQDVPNLERLYLDGPIGRIREEQTISIVQPRPRLRTLVICSLRFETNSLAFFNPGWMNLTHLALLMAISAENPIFLILQMCPNLDHLVISPVRLSGWNHPTSLTHPKLRVLELMGLSDDDLCPDRLMLPNLRQLLCIRNTVCDFDPTFEEIPTHERPLLDGPGHLNMALNGYFIDLFHAGSFFGVFNPGWKELTHLRLNIECRGNIVEILLQLCPRLENMEIISTANVTLQSHQNPLVHPVLRSLKVHLKHGAISTVLGALNLPSLRHLDFTLLKNRGWPRRRFKHFLTRSQCPLETLRIKGPKVPSKSRKEFTSMLPTLKRLDLDHGKEDILDAMESDLDETESDSVLSELDDDAYKLWMSYP